MFTYLRVSKYVHTLGKLLKKTKKVRRILILVQNLIHKLLFTIQYIYSPEQS